MELKNRKYTASVTRSGGNFLDIILTQPPGLELSQKFTKLPEKYSGLVIKEQPKGYGFWITFPRVWDSNTVMAECICILLDEGFAENTLLIHN